MSKKNRAVDRASRAAAAMAEQERQERRRRNTMVGGVVLGVVVIVLAGWLLSRSLDSTTDVDAPAAGSEFGLTVGPDDAADKVVVYEDFLCPYCQHFEEASRDGLRQLATDGKVQVEYRPINFLSPISDYSERSADAFAVVLDTAGADVALKFHDALFENQPSEKGPFPDDDEIVDLAVEAGADEAEVKAGLENGDGKDWVEQATASAKDAGVRGTPTVLLNGEVYQNGRTQEEIAANLVQEIG